MMLAAMTLQGLNDPRPIYLYDTFAGMVEPGERDIDYTGRHISYLLDGHPKKATNVWAAVALDEVRRNFEKIAYPNHLLYFIKGDVRRTIPDTLPDSISILRLDTDWYESSYHELTHLYPLLSPNGVLIVDDYGHFQGQREAVDQYFKTQGISLLLNSIDYTCRVAIKA